MKRLQRVHRMQRLRFSISVGPKSTSALTPSPSKVRRGKSMRLSSLPNAYEKSCSGHSPPLSHTGQSSGWLMSRNSKTPLRPSTASAILRVHHHALGHRRRARRLQLRHLLDLHETDAARRVDAQTGVVAVIGDLDAGLDGGLEDGGALRHGQLAAIDGQRDVFHDLGMISGLGTWGLGLGPAVGALELRQAPSLKPQAYLRSITATAPPSWLTSTDRKAPDKGSRCSVAASVSVTRCSEVFPSA